jgi:2-polyprenyl-6-methoxyphenol hydroxylase-like FAD-dependent oxidoreductase
MRVLVSGAGISGLTFAAAMRRFCPAAEVVIFERDEAPDSRPQGYGLGMDRDAGQLVLRELGLRDELAGDAVPITRFVFCDRRGRSLLELPSGGGDRLLRVRRDALKRALRAAAPDTPLRFGWRCTGYRQDAAGVEALFEGHREPPGDYLVACDGVGSPVRAQLLGDDRHYLGLTSIVGDAPVALDDPLLRGGYLMMLGDAGDSVFCYRERGGVHVSYTSHVRSEDELAGLDRAALHERVRRATAGWHQPAPALAEAIDPATLVVRGFYDRDPVARVRDGRVWLIGDAAHPMSPYRGQGANMAMLDGWRLAQALGVVAAEGEGEAGPAALARMERDIAARGRKAVLVSRKAAAQYHLPRSWRRLTRDLGFRWINLFIGLFSREPKPRPAPRRP